MTEINGICEERFLPLKEAFAANFDEGLEIGSSVAVTHQGRSVVDLWAGYADPERTRPWQQDTIVCVFSTTKAMVIACMLKLVADGKLDLDEPVATYWPEFDQAGKSEITTRHVLLHQAGMPGFTEAQTFEAMHDWGYVIDTLSRQEPWFEPGSYACYHPLTYGFILGEITRRLTGRLLSEYFVEEFARPADIDFHIGLKDRTILDRVARLAMPESFLAPGVEGMGARAFRSVANGDMSGSGSWEYLSAEVPSGNGCGNARSIARFGAILAMSGELDGRRYLPAEIVEAATTEQCYLLCEPFGMVRFGLGFGLDCETYRAPSPTSFHWGGYGGSSIVMDRTTGVSFGYAPNDLHLKDNFGVEMRLERLWNALGRVMEGL
jgi:CubicO group peptidase (beta-lactamase class C family)